MVDFLDMWLTDNCFISLEDRTIGIRLDALVTSLRQTCLKPKAAKTNKQNQLQHSKHK